MNEFEMHVNVIGVANFSFLRTIWIIFLSPAPQVMLNSQPPPSQPLPPQTSSIP